MKLKKKTTKLTYLESALIIIGFLGTVVAYVFESKLFGEASVFNKSVSSNSFVDKLYQAIPSVIKSIQVITIAVLISLLIRLIMRKGFARTNRGITIVKLLESFVKWVVAIIAILAVLSAWGVDTTTLLASAGILTLVIGLGAQSLVADIVAGMFIVFEGAFQVGDIVIINGWRGTVKEIGIRTTQIVDAGNNVNIINNSQISTIVNQTQDISVAKCYVSIEYGESIPKVERIILDNFDRIRKNVPGIVDGPFYKGVDALASSSVDLLVTCKCKEEDVYQVQRDLNREMKLIFDDNGINIPFPQIVLNQRDVIRHAKVEEKDNSSAKE